MVTKSLIGAGWRRALSEALRTIRRARLFKVRQIAASMGMRLRSYEYFESGRANPNLERIHCFGRVSQADPHGIVAAMMINSPRFALRAADNRLVTTFLIELEYFDAALGDDITLLNTGDFVSAFGAAFDVLVELGQQRAEQRDRYRAALPGETVEGPQPDGSDATDD